MSTVAVSAVPSNLLYDAITTGKPDDEVTIGSITIGKRDLFHVVKHSHESNGEQFDPAAFDAYMDVVFSDPSILQDDIDRYANIPVATVRVPEPSESLIANALPDPAPVVPTTPDPVVPVSVTPSAPAPVVPTSAITQTHESAVADIVGLVRAKYEDEGTRNFAIGKRAYEHATWQRANFPGYQGSDFDALMNRVRDEVRVHVAINPASIRLGDWVRCHVMRELVRTSAGDDIANRLSLFEYGQLIPHGLAFDKGDVVGELKPGWLDLVKEVSTLRIQGTRVSADDFATRVKANVDAIKSNALAALDPVTRAAQLASETVNKATKAKAQANSKVTTAVSDALAGKHLDSAGVLSIVGTVAKSHGAKLPKLFGFDAEGCTVDDCRTLAKALLKAGKLREIKALHAMLAKILESAQKASEKTEASRDVATAKVA